MPSQPSLSGPVIHWIGAGLASGPGIVALADKWGQITVWDLFPDQADALKKHITKDARLNIYQLDLNNADSRAKFCAALRPGDIIVSMLPAAFHLQMADIALREKCHIVTSSYLTADMARLHDKAVTKGLSLVNEVGLDPGIDHLLTHMLVDAARNAGVLGRGHAIDFISYCGGFPLIETPFTYKFSWTPLGVLTALTNPAKMIRNGKEHTVEKAWQNVTDFSLEGENFEAYANRNSLPYVAVYDLDEESNLQTFVRGTLRLSGWKEAWKDIFATLEKANPQDLKNLSEQLWQDHQYEDGEQDRVVLHVALSTTATDGEIWKASLSLDTKGAGWQSAMANCVSLTVAEAVNALMAGRLAPGIQCAPHDITEARTWLKGLQLNGVEIRADNVDLGI
ncbi:MAG: saccharopine dehydrogenase [Alphaproteobacteria bacterium]|nr:MAG: saccharopine dehydrogenase [Alphaproteobacteria bacterium]